MIVLEFKVKGKPHQYLAVDEAIRTVQFVRNKCVRLWIDGEKVGQKEIYAYTTRLRKEFPFVDKLNSTACQQACERAWTSITRFYDNCKRQIKGKKGYPKFQKDNRSVEYKQSGWKLSEDRRRVTFTDKKGIGTFKLVGGWDLNFYPVEEIKRVRLIKRADGYYCQFVLNVDTRQYAKPLEPATHCIGLDVGLKVFYANSDGETVEIPRFYRKAEKRLNRLNRRKSKKFRKGQKQSNNYIKARKRYARQHLKVSRKRKGFAVREALRVIRSNDLVAYEDLNVKGLVRSNLAKSINDAAWSTFRQWLEYFGYKYGKATIAVPPHNTSQNCSNCGEKVAKSLSTRTHVCSHCGYIEDRDVNAAINILKLGLSMVGHTGSKAWGDLPSGLVGEILLGHGESVNRESPATSRSD
jgi:putative transposase